MPVGPNRPKVHNKNICGQKPTALYHNREIKIHPDATDALLGQPLGHI